VGVDQCPVQLAAPMLGFLAQVGSDNVMQYHPVGVLPIVTDQSEISQTLAVSAGLKP
jgi:hypothetical protein